MASENIGWDPLRVELLWDLRERPRRGPRPTLTVEQIARTGMAIADQEGMHVGLIVDEEPARFPVLAHQ